MSFTNSRLIWTVLPRWCNIWYTCWWEWQCNIQAAALKLVIQYQQFLDMNFKKYLIICSPDIEHVWEVNVISSTN